MHLLGAGVTRLVGDADLLVVVGKQTEREVELVVERLVLFRRIEADAEDFAVVLRILLGLITQALALNRSTGRVGLRVPPQQHPAAAQIGERDGAAVLVGNREVGRR